MKGNKGQFISQTGAYNGYPTDKIILENCPRGYEKCQRILVDVNHFFRESNLYQHNKEYQLSILSLKKAFAKTYELDNPFELECANIVRETVIDSLKNIHQELKRMTRGFFRKNRYKLSTILAEKALIELHQKLTGQSAAAPS